MTDSRVLRGASVLALAFLPLSSAAAAPDSARQERRVTAKEFRVIPSQSGSVNYYTVIDAQPEPYIHAASRPKLETAVLGYAVPESWRGAIQTIRWKWRAVTLPSGGDECQEGKGDSAAVVYVTWRRGLRWYSLKYVWSAVGKKGSTCDRKRNPFRAQDTIIVDSGAPLNEWRTVEIDPNKEFRSHFEDGDPKASVPDLIGVAIMSDGDQTDSPSSADYAGFVIVTGAERR